MLKSLTKALVLFVVASFSAGSAVFLTDDGLAGPAAAADNPQDPLTIGASLHWNTFLGGSGSDEGRAIAVDAGGNVYVAGDSSVAWGSPIRPYAGGGDAFAAKFDANGSLIWITFLGSASYDVGRAIAVDTSGNVYVAGTSSASWGTPAAPHMGGERAFAAKLNGSGALQWNSFLALNLSEWGRAIAVDTSGNVYVAGNTNHGSGQGTDAFVAILNASGGPGWTAILGAAPSVEYAQALALDNGGNIYVAGTSDGTWGSPVRPFGDANDAFAAKLTGSGGVIWTTFLGGNDSDAGNGIAVDGNGNVYVAGDSDATWGSPLRPFGGSTDGFAAKLNGSGALQWNFFLGSSQSDSADAVSLDSNGNLHVAGHSNATWGLPARPHGGNGDAYAAKLDGSGVLQWHAFLGGSSDDGGFGIAAGANGNVYVTGTSNATWGLPIRPYSSLFDAFAARIREGRKDELVGTWDGQGVYYRDSDSGAWTMIATPADKIACGDLFGDGKDDLIGIWASQAGVWTRSSADGSWSFLSSTARDIASGDMNGDGRADFLGTWDGQGAYFRDSVTGQWTLIATPATLITAGDLDGDSKADLIGIWPTQAGVWVKYSQAGAWGYIGSSARDMTTGDMNGDGRADLVGTWDGQGVFYKDSISGQWTQISTPADQITAGDLDGDGSDDLIGIWSGQAGIWVKLSQAQAWTYIGSSARDIAAGKMKGETGSGAAGKALGFAMPRSPNPAGPGRPGFADFSAEGPGGMLFQFISEPSLTPPDRKDARFASLLPGPGEPGFVCVRQRNLSPRQGH